DVASQLSSRNEEMAVSVMETPDTSENANIIAGPSGIRPCLLKQAEKKGFVCGLCHREFAESWEFDIHYRTHTGEKPFMCERAQDPHTWRTADGIWIRNSNFPTQKTINYHQSTSAPNGDSKYDGFERIHVMLK
ncbi:hypothetical protein AVEN_178970-1, partial [Araneus ventricosus]